MAAPSPIRPAWRPLLAAAAVFLLLSMLALVAPRIAALAVEQVAGWLLLFWGIAGLIFAWGLRGTGAERPFGVLAALFALLGLVFVLSPPAGLTTLVVLLVAVLLLEGLASIQLALRLRGRTGRWAWLLASGICALALALLIVNGVPGTGAVALGLLLGPNFLSSGAALAAVALGLRSLER